MPAAELARALNVPTNRITGILNGQRAITADTALRLGHWFGTSAEFWLNLQKLYELRLAENEKGAEIANCRSARRREQRHRSQETNPNGRQRVPNRATNCRL